MTQKTPIEMNMDNPFYKGDQGRAIQEIASLFLENGFCCYVAGGAVRDFLLKRPFTDIDLVTNAKPREIVKLFPKNIQVGLQFGIVIIIHKGWKFDVATFRSDGEYRDGRHPTSIEFTDSEKDAQRRDFTINALFYDLNANKIIDYVQGLQDLNHKTIRAVGTPELRFQQDHLRILRALRFQAQLNFHIEDETWKAILHTKQNLIKVSIERIYEELKKGVYSSHPDLFVHQLSLTQIDEVLFKPLLGADNISKESPLKSREEQCPFYLKVDFGLQKKSTHPSDVLGFILNCLYGPFLGRNAFQVQKSEDLNLVWSNKFLDDVLRISKFFKLSHQEKDKLKIILALEAWLENWNQLRPGVRYDLIFKMQHSSFYLYIHKKYPEDCEKALQKPTLFLKGQDVEMLPHALRGEFLKQLLYFQWEDKIKSHEQALEFLNHVYSKHKEKGSGSSN